MEAPGVDCGRLLGEGDVRTPGWGYDGTLGLGCDGTPGWECNGDICFLVPALGWAGVLGFRGGTCILEFMGNTVAGFWCAGVLGFRGSKAPEFEGTGTAVFVLTVGWAKVPESCCAGVLGFEWMGVDKVLGLRLSGSNSLAAGIFFVEAVIVEVGFADLDMEDTLDTKPDRIVPVPRLFLMLGEGRMVLGPAVVEVCLLVSLSSLGCTMTSEVKGVTKLYSRDRLRTLAASRWRVVVSRAWKRASNNSRMVT